MSKKPYRGILKEDRVSIFALNPTIARWILRRPLDSDLKNLFGHAVNWEHNGILFRDEDEAVAAQRRQDQDKWQLEAFGQPDGYQLVPYAVSQEELDAKDEKGYPVIPLIEWPYIMMVRKAQTFQSTPQEVPVGPTRRELFHFIRDRSVALATVTRDLSSLQTQIIELQKAMAAMVAAQDVPAQVMPGVGPIASPPPPAPVLVPTEPPVQVAPLVPVPAAVPVPLVVPAAPEAPAPTVTPSPEASAPVI